jgi:hypothetical protein
LDACDAILEGYKDSLHEEGCPIVLAERETNLEKLGIEAIEPPQDFWPKLNHRPPVRNGHFPHAARKAIAQSLPEDVPHRIVTRESGMGSLGQPRYVAIAEWRGGFGDTVTHYSAPLRARLLPRHLRALLPRFRQANRNGLLPTLDAAAFSAPARLQRSVLPPAHRAPDAFL